MRPVLVIVEQVGRHQAFEMPLIQDNHVQQVASATSHTTLSHTVLPRTAKGRASRLASYLPHSRNHIGTKLCVAVEQQESVRLLHQKLFALSGSVPVTSLVDPSLEIISRQPQDCRLSQLNARKVRDYFYSAESAALAPCRMWRTFTTRLRLSTAYIIL
jgi:hypothetical protein